MHTHRPFSRWLHAIAALTLAAIFMSASAGAFPHVVQPNETLASLAKRYYGRIQYERILSTANGLTGARVRGLTPGMLLEIPAVTYKQVGEGETWKSLAARLLGDEGRYIFLAQSNGHKPWIQPELGQLIAIPYHLTWVATGDESLATLAYRYLGSTKEAYQLVHYNGLSQNGPKRGDVLVIPLTNLPLTDEGRAAAEEAAASLSEQSQGAHFERQKLSARETQMLSEDVRGGRYISAVIRGTELLALGRLTQPGRALVQRLLLEAYVALDAQGPARTACEAWRGLDPEATLDSMMTSPKILRLCPNERGGKRDGVANEAKQGDATSESDEKSGDEP